MFSYSERNIKHIRRLLLIVSAGLFILGALQKSLTTVPFKISHLLSKDHPVRLEYERYTQLFPSDEDFFLLIENVDHTPINSIGRLLEKLHFDLRRNPLVKSVSSISNEEYLEVTDSQVRLKAFLDGDYELSSKARGLLEVPFFSNRLLDKKWEYVLVSGKLFSNLDVKRERASLASLIELTSDFEKENPSLKTYLLGTKVGQYYLFKETIQNQIIITPLLFLLLAILVFYLFRSWKTLFLFASIMLISYAFVIYFIVWNEGGISAYSNFAMFFVLIVATSDLIHFFSSFVSIKNDNLNKKLLAVNEHVYWPCLLTTLTTSICFLALVPNDFIPIRNIGIYSSIGAITCFITTFHLLPFLIKEWNFNLFHEKGISNFRFSGWLNFSLRNPKTIVATFTILSLFFIYKSLGLKVDDRFYDKFNDDHPLSLTIEKFTDSFSFIGSIELEIRPKRTSSYIDPKLQKALLAFEKKVEQIDGVSHVQSFSKFNEYLDLEFLSHYGATQKAKESKESFYYMLNSEGIFEGLINEKRNTSRSMVFVDTLSSKKLAGIIRQIEKIARDEKYRELFTLQANGFASIRSYFFNNLTSNMIKSIAMSLVLIFVVFLFVFRSFYWASLAMLPNLIPIIFIFGILALLGKPIESNIILLICITVGIAVDDTIHFLVALKKEIREKGEIEIEAIKRAFNKTSKALIGTTFVFVLSFPCFFLANLKIFSQVGIFVMLSMVVALVADLSLLPVLFSKFKKQS